MSVLLRTAAIVLLALIARIGHTGEVVRIAVAANFKATLEELTTLYAQRHPTRFVISSGSSGVLYAQIHAGAPFDLFFSADAARPEQLERDGMTVLESRRTYAIGRLVLWTPGRLIVADVEQTLRSRDIRTVALANPATAPYGAAAREVLTALQLADRFRIVRGENVGQAFQFVATGNAEAGFVARSQIRDYERANGRSLVAEMMTVDPTLYTPIEQQSVLLLPGEKSAAAREFMEFVFSEEAQRTITAAGYRSLTWLPPGCHGCERPESARTQAMPKSSRNPGP